MSLKEQHPQSTVQNNQSTTFMETIPNFRDQPSVLSLKRAASDLRVGHDGRSLSHTATRKYFKSNIFSIGSLMSNVDDKSYFGHIEGSCKSKKLKCDKSAEGESSVALLPSEYMMC